jgi:hypothetical protein
MVAGESGSARPSGCSEGEARAQKAWAERDYNRWPARPIREERTIERERERNRVHSVSHINDGIPPLGRNNLNGFLLLEEPESSPTSFAS